MRVVIVEPLKPARVEEIEAGLESLQHIVGGYIEAVYPFDDPVCLICNEEGKINGISEPNRALRDDAGKVYDVIYGSFLCVGLGDEDFCSLSDELAAKYCGLFSRPEIFLAHKDRLVAVPL